MNKALWIATLPALVGLAVPAGAQTSEAAVDVPVFQIQPQDCTVTFSVKASVAIAGTFDKWDASLKFKSTEGTSGVIDIKIDAASVKTGSGMKDGKLKGKDFFDVKNSPYITFHSNKVVQTGHNTFDITGTFSIRGVSRTETLTFTAPDIGKGEGEIKGTMAFDRKEYGMNSGIPFIKIADRVEVTVVLRGKRVSGPPLVFKQ